MGIPRPIERPDMARATGEGRRRSRWQRTRLLSDHPGFVGLRRPVVRASRRSVARRDGRDLRRRPRTARPGRLACTVVVGGDGETRSRDASAGAGTRHVVLRRSEPSSSCDSMTMDARRRGLEEEGQGRICCPTAVARTTQERPPRLEGSLVERQALQCSRRGFEGARSLPEPSLRSEDTPWA